MRRLGILGGTFDPPHHGHLVVAADVAREFALERVVLVPAANPPHKERADLSPAEIRLEMTRAAVQGDGRFEVSDVEIRRGGASYTVDTLRTFRAEAPDAELYFLLGTDQFASFERWHEPAEVARLATLIVMSRAGEDDIRPPGDLDVGYRESTVRRIDISSTGVRASIRGDGSCRYLVPEAVRHIIEREGLYRP